jgi:hypothetical protein
VSRERNAFDLLGYLKDKGREREKFQVTLLVSIKGSPLEITSAGRPYLFLNKRKEL